MKRFTSDGVETIPPEAHTQPAATISLTSSGVPVVL
jgi:hypothetical protein